MKALLSVSLALLLAVFAHSEAADKPDSTKSANSLPYGRPVPGKPGIVTSPYTGKYIDVTGWPVGKEVRDPYVGKLFLVPKPVDLGAKDKALQTNIEKKFKENSSQRRAKDSTLEGDWEPLTAETAERNGPLKPGAWHFRDGTLTYGTEGAQTRTLYSVDPTKTPKEINTISTFGDRPGKTKKGIYKIENNRLTICDGPLDGPRPTEFSTKGKGVVIMKLRRK